jgi:hypothetical protein
MFFCLWIDLPIFAIQTERPLIYSRMGFETGQNQANSGGVITNYPTVFQTPYCPMSSYISQIVF